MKFVTRKWIKVNDLLNRQYSANKNSIQGLTSILRLDLCDYSKAYIAAKRRITVIETNNANKRNKKLSLNNNVPFRSCMSKINNTIIENTENLNIFMPVQN